MPRCSPPPQRGAGRDQPFRQVLMNFLRASPSSFLAPASLLQFAIRCCCFFCASVGPLAVAPPLRQSLMNFLRASPSSFLAPACLLQSAIRCCCFFCASVGSFFAFSCASASGAATSIRLHIAAITSLLI